MADAKQARLHDARRHAQQQRDEWHALESRASWTRLLVFLALVATWIFLARFPFAAAALSVLWIILFVAVVRRHHACLARREFLDRQLVILDETRARFGGQVVCVRDWRRPPDEPAVETALPRVFDPGPTWALSEQERDDLDLFAPPVGVFGLLNRASTSVGARRLRDWLEHPLLAAPGIRRRQAAARALADEPEVRWRLMAAAATLRKEDARLARLVAATAGVQGFELRFTRWLLRAWSLVSIALAVFVLARLFLGDYGWLAVWAPALVANGVLLFSRRESIEATIAPWRDVAWAARGLLACARQALADLPAEGELTPLRERLAAVARPDALPRLAPLLGRTESGGAVHTAMNLVGLRDLHFADALSRRALPLRESLPAAVSALAELEALCSLAALAWEQPMACTPAIAVERALHIRGGRHPLVPPERVVANDVELDASCSLWVVTGSNMAGKSTFLRMVGVNALLAQVGGPVLADEMRLSPARLITDLRARDSLAANESYFLSEVRHLRRMLAPPDAEQPVLGLIDEPFRGTNSQDQTAASVAVVRRLMQRGDLFLLATHDRALTTLADNGVSKNFHFRENLGAGGMVFDYRLHPGPAQTRNALRILEMEGYPAEVVAWAREWIERNG